MAMTLSSGSSQEDMAGLLNALSSIGTDKKKPVSSNTQSSKAVSQISV